MMDVLFDEVESLEAILMDDVKIHRNPETGIPDLIETTILPTVGEAIDQQYVCITLQVIPTDNYPDVRPIFHLRNPRGLDDHLINRIKSAVEQKLDESIGVPVVFDLIDVIREHLTDSNLPSGQCVVCLYGFQDGDEFTKTICYHYLHSYCLVRHLLASKKNYQEEQDKLPAWQQQLSKPFQAFCPVCRDPIDYDVEPLRKAKPPIELKNAPKFELTDELKELQVRMSNLFMKQKKRGGIIDLDAAETNVISIESEENTDGTLKSEESQGSSERQPSNSTATVEHQFNVPNRNSSNRSTKAANSRNSHSSSHNHHHHHHHHFNHHQDGGRHSANGNRNKSSRYKRAGGSAGGSSGSAGSGGSNGASGSYSNHSSNAPIHHPGCSNPR